MKEALAADSTSKFESLAIAENEVGVLEGKEGVIGAEFIAAVDAGGASVIPPAEGNASSLTRRGVLSAAAAVAATFASGFTGKRLEAQGAGYADRLKIFAKEQEVISEALAKGNSELMAKAIERVPSMVHVENSSPADKATVLGSDKIPTRQSPDMSNWHALPLRAPLLEARGDNTHAYTIGIRIKGSNGADSVLVSAAFLLSTKVMNKSIYQGFATKGTNVIEQAHTPPEIYKNVPAFTKASLAKGGMLPVQPVTIEGWRFDMQSKTWMPAADAGVAFKLSHHRSMGNVIVDTLAKGTPEHLRAGMFEYLKNCHFVPMRGSGRRAPDVIYAGAPVIVTDEAGKPQLFGMNGSYIGIPDASGKLLFEGYLVDDIEQIRPHVKD